MMRALLLSLCGLTIAGCHKEAARPAVVVDAQPRAIALAHCEGKTPVDVLIGQLQDKAKGQPDKIDWWIALGRAWVRKARESTDPGYYRNADAAATTALEVKANAPAALNLKGLVLLSDHRFAEAKALAQSTLAGAPDDAMAWGNLSDAELELGDFAGAAEATQKMVSLKPNNPSYLRAAYLRWLQGDDAGAKSIMRLAIDAASDSRDPEPRAYALTQAALIFWHEGDYEGARAGFDKALETFANYPPALVGIARCDLAAGNAGAAVARLKAAEAQSPLVETRWLLGDACELAGDMNCAEEARAKARKQGRRGDPRTLSLFLSARNEASDEALQLAEEESKTRGDLYTVDALAFALLRAGRVADAKVNAEKAIALGTNDARVLFHAGAVLLAAGDVVKGKELLKRALALNPKFDVRGAAEANQLLAKAN